MLKRCLLAVIVALLVVTSSQIAAAEDYDWSKAPRIGTKAELARYIESERRRVDAKHPLGQTEFHFVLMGELKVATKEEFDNSFAKLAGTQFIKMALVQNVVIHGTYFADGTIQMTCKMIEFPGTRVANAYFSSNQQQAWLNLNHEEQELYNVAVGIVDEANKLSSEREKARYIHDEICKRVIAFKSENDRNKTAIGALIDGYAQCQGFTDAFYMLGRMACLEVGRIDGTNNVGGHAWNWITFNNGKSYCVDVTNGFFTKSEYLFCSTKERMEKAGWWCNWEIIPNLQ